MKIESDTQHSHKTKQRKKNHPIHKSLLSPILLFLFYYFRLKISFVTSLKIKTVLSRTDFLSADLQKFIL